jgi:YidC/Oxa1 family membrane protein insertase
MMDRNSLIGLVLIGLILSVFAIINQPTEEELRKQEQELADTRKKELEAASKEKETVKKQSKSTLKNGASVQTVVSKEEFIRLENNKLIVEISTKGGKVSSVWLKEFESYKDFARKRNEKGPKKIDPLQLFQNGDAVNQLRFIMNGKSISTGKLDFEVATRNNTSITLTSTLSDGEKITFKYALKNDAYDLDYTLKMEGFKGKVTPQNVLFAWQTAFRKTERLFSEQRRVSTVCYNQTESGLDYLSEMGSDAAEAEENIEWIAFKQSYFASIIRPEKPFDKKGSKFSIYEYPEGHSKRWTHLKNFKSENPAGFTSSDDMTLHMNWFFGPNDYEVLKSYNEGYDDILNFGWGLFRWINLYAVQPLFNFLITTGMSVGIAILMLTLILKFILMPIQWKMYISSAKMRILKPEIDELNKKYPNQEDAMKKQMEMMTLYRESGASPFSGCIPMLIQMPILLAVFRFFPSAFELRQKSFLWAEDLSSYDSILDFGFNIWPYGDHVSLFTLLMSGTTLLYTYLNSGNMQQPQQPGMPNMKVIMYIFPVMMIFFFNNYSAGLSYYYFISTLISILIMVLIKQFFADEDKLKAKMAERKAAATANPKTKKKSKFQERLEMMQKLQQEQLKNRKK